MFFSFPNDFNGGNDMKKIIFSLSLLVLVFALISTADAGEKYKSLRGGTDIEAGSNPSVGMDWQPTESTIARTFDLQPPLIPHDISDYEVNINENACLECHVDPDSGAKICSTTHFMDRDQNKIYDNVTSLRYFCLQCHVGQVDAKPLVKNTFQAK
jgi:cytochrome c-type protein NapB